MNPYENINSEKYLFLTKIFEPEENSLEPRIEHEN